ncbi:methyl-accepting chemotaxis protein [Tepidimonas taiwanensis]|uniref:Aerotaxis receptor n=1 Tax=Tepidimonas taiwanensis TaxID=307486 RepID=A0A554WYB0_9BURK|nr:PAS domain-containing methyl-accepting chemotaxis protein [Tepidimonas taiwanensis]MCX7693962.1 methyl-accepting chemotaxis protein [Tepidimonas taiwanensis]MDM7463327.1 methyl-accepting chemotaxis protein [Tepidimonas taiwanensis]TSE28539.1 Aerotaxis receptor [Tepidimonas taiwanensis]UBQ05286.1 methyl-accepting chemotaxis protein [Tepidimonas taiwanensis]
MRRNLPVTQREYAFDGRTTLLSTTDPKGRITYANAAFNAVSGFDAEELTGQPHNIVRHPDMPPEAFEDMWRTIKSGLSWTALVKNRRKDGDHYWVRANAAPMVRDGQLVGYLSVRTAPERSEIEAAERLYAAFREGRAKGLAFDRGLVVRTGWQSWRSWTQRASTAARLRVGLWAAALLPAAAAVGFGAITGAWPVAGVVGAVAVVGAALADLWLTRQILQPLRSIREHALSVAAGNLYTRPPLNRVDDIGLLARSINQAGLNLRALVDDVAAQVAGVSAASEQIAQGNDDLSQRTERAAASLEETAASTEQITATVRQNAENTRTATEVAQQTMAAADEGAHVVQCVVQTMGQIAAGSQRIADITGLIDSIAFQTNILALNAAVEAARAGEAGRGFAVVAGEVRSLAQRSAEAAKEIRALIQASVEQVKAGSAQAQEAGERIASVVEHIRRVSTFIEEIATASAQQSGGVAQIGAAMGQLDRDTQQNAALVEELSAAARSLHARAERLSDALAVWRVGARA